MADLIDNANHAWRQKHVRAFYPNPMSFEILSLPISKIGTDVDKLVWRHSSLGDYQVKKAYNIISSETDPTNPIIWYLV